MQSFGKRLKNLPYLWKMLGYVFGITIIIATIIVSLVYFLGFNYPLILYRLQKKIGMTTIEESVRLPPKSSETIQFLLIPHQGEKVQAINVPELERWKDIAGCPYSKEFRQKFSYVPEKNQLSILPTIRLQYEKEFPSWKGRIEVQGLKPNFVYQIKLNGNFHQDRMGFEIIGKLGRWRLPGWETNYTDKDFDRLSEKDKEKVESYILFDYLITNAEGAAAVDFELQESLHVIWREDQRKIANRSHLQSVRIIRSPLSVSYRHLNPIYSEHPLQEEINLWAERELVRYTFPHVKIRLPPRLYHAFLVLTEESFHDKPPEGGWWATIVQHPVTFRITE